MFYKPVLLGFVLNSAPETFFAEIDTCESLKQVSKQPFWIKQKTNFILLITEKFLEQDMRLQFDKNKKMQHSIRNYIFNLQIRKCKKLTSRALFQT